MTPPIPSPSLLIFGFGGPVEILVILVVILLLFGGRIPALARSLGQGIVEFRKGLKDPGKDEDSSSDEEDASKRNVSDSSK